MISILPVDERVVEQSLNSDFSDFEDAIQYFTAVNNGISTLVTRNISDYKKSKITVVTAEEFLAVWQSESKNNDAQKPKKLTVR